MTFFFNAVTTCGNQFRYWNIYKIGDDEIVCEHLGEPECTVHFSFSLRLPASEIHAEIISALEERLQGSQNILQSPLPPSAT